MSIDKGAWAGKAAVVVGASSGLGKTLVHELARQGASHLTLVARNENRLQETALEIARQWPAVQTTCCVADVTTAEGAARLAAWAASAPASIDLLINAVGLSDRGTILKLTTERLDELLRANICGPLTAIQTIQPLLARGSVVINIGSLSSLFAPRHLGGYSIAKHGLRALTQQLRLELREAGIHILLACPGPIARSDSGSRYATLKTADDVPPEALAGGGGAKIKGLEPGQLARDILRAATGRQLELIRPRKARWLMWLIALCPGWGESFLRRMTS